MEHCPATSRCLRTINRYKTALVLEFLSNEIGDASNDDEGKIDLYRLQFFTPAEHVPSEITMKSLLNPVHRLDTTLMNKARRVELPMICSQKQSELRSRRLRNRSENAKNSLPDKINETILKYSVVTTGGLERPMCALDLFDRGLIPPNVQVQFHPPVMRTSTAPIHDSKECEDKIKISVSDFRVYEHTFNTDGYRRIYGKGAMRTQPGPVSLRSVHSGDDHSTPVTEIQLPKQPPSTPAPNMEDDTLHWLRVECGVFDRRCAAFQDFEEHYSRLWPRISRVMEKLEQLFAKYNITTVVVNGKQ
ncbi:unnamed protein product [Dicrocoelium dendriticum]|nr:unnamed protein product [Dicrocoelium dendriticum]